jgi:hypothetical protein
MFMLQKVFIDLLNGAHQGAAHHGFKAMKLPH